MGRFQFTLRTLLAAIAVLGIVLWLYQLYQLGRLGPPILLTLAAFLVFIVCPVLIAGQPDAVKSILVYATPVLCFGGLCFLLAPLMLSGF